MSEDFVCSLLGSGSQEDPWKITSEKDMLEVQGNLEANHNFAGRFFLITENITLGRMEPWSTDGKAWGGLGMAAIEDNKDSHSPYATEAGIGFAGTLDGGGHIVTVHRTADNVSGVGGLVNYLAPSGVVKNVTMVGMLTVTGDNIDAVGGVVGYNSGTIQNVTNQVVVTAIGAYNVGGVVGFNNGYYGSDGNKATGDNLPKGVIEHCMNHASIMGYAKVGGITGEDSGFIAACANVRDEIFGENASKDGVGGIAGRNGDNDAGVETGIIKNCYNTGEIIDYQGSWIGGITGFQDDKSSCQNCYNIGKIVGYSYRDNIAGDNENKDDGVVNSYGEETEDGSPANGAQHYDGADLLPLSDMIQDPRLEELGLSSEQAETLLLTSLNGNPSSGVWTQKPGKFPSLVNCGNKVAEIDENAFVINLVAYPNALTYVKDEEFDTYGMVIQAIYENGKRVTIDQHSVSVNLVVEPKGALSNVGVYDVVVAGTYPAATVTQSFTFVFQVAVEAANTPDGTVIMGVGKAGCWATLKGAIAAANGGTIYVADTIPLGSGIYDGQDGSAKVTIQRYGGGDGVEAFQNIMFKIATETNYDSEPYDPDQEASQPQDGPAQAEDVTLENMTLKGTTDAASAPMIQVDSGTLTLGSKVTLENNQIPDTSTDRSEDSSKRRSAKEGSWSGIKNDAQRGAGVSIHGGTVNCQGEVSGCDTLEGGGFSVSAGALNLTGTITGCTGTNGSAIYQQGGKVTMSGDAKISGCTADAKGTVLVTCGDRDETSEFFVSGGEISKNTAPEGSILYIEGGKAVVTDGTLKGEAGGVYIANQYIMKKGKLDKTVTGLFDMSKGTLEKDADADTPGAVNKSGMGALAVIAGGLFELNGGTVNDAILVQNDLVVVDEDTGEQEIVRGDLTMADGNVNANGMDTAIAVNGGDATVKGGTVTGTKDAKSPTSMSQAVSVDCVSMSVKEKQSDGTVKTATKRVKGMFTLKSNGKIVGGDALAALNINGGEAVMEGGEIEAGTDYGVRVSSMTIEDFATKATETVVGTFLMKNGKINGGEKVPAVVACGGEFTLEGGTISNEGGCAIRVNSSSGSKFTIAGNAIIDGGIFVESGARIYLGVVLTNSINIVVPEDTSGGTIIATCSSLNIATSNTDKIIVKDVAGNVRSVTRASVNFLLT